MVQPLHRSRGDSSSLMGELLLKGWPMLADSCDLCSVPLMRDPATSLDHCVSCSRVYRNGQLHTPGHLDPAAPSHFAAPDTDMPDGPAQQEHTQQQQQQQQQQQGAEEEEDHPAAPATTTDPQPSHSPGAAPPQPQPTTAGATPEPRPWSQVNGHHSQHGRAQSAASAESDRVAELMSQRMLQGWALLNTPCPRCSTPLLRKRGPPLQLYCVACDMPVVPEADVRPGSTTAAPVQATPAAPATGTATNTREEGTTAERAAVPLLAEGTQAGEGTAAGPPAMGRIDMLPSSTAAVGAGAVAGPLATPLASGELADDEKERQDRRHHAHRHAAGAAASTSSAAEHAMQQGRQEQQQGQQQQQGRQDGRQGHPVQRQQQGSEVFETLVGTLLAQVGKLGGQLEATPICDTAGHHRYLALLREYLVAVQEAKAAARQAA